VQSRVVATLLLHNPASLVDDVVRGIAMQTHRPTHLIVLDNGSEPATPTASLVEQLDADMQVVALRSDVNLGVGAGHNVLLRAALDLHPAWIWVLEHDTLAQPDCLEDLLSAAGTQNLQRLGAVMPGRRATRDEDPTLGSARGRPRFTFNGVLLASDAVRALGPLREDTFVGGEDWDYSSRMISAGWLIEVRDTVTVTHPSKGMRRRGMLPSPARSYYSMRSQLLRQPVLSARLGMAVRLALGGVLDLGRPDSRQRVAARLHAIGDGLLRRGGRRDYVFMR
jgi:rhamnopyranosyl-N-acetylglucosaminyl-diphospho-decaprenol beta-1,3/1,4-galactofuranosyltransferase